MLDEILITAHREVILQECPKLIAENDVKSESHYTHLTTHTSLHYYLPHYIILHPFSELNLMFHLMERVPNGVQPMLEYLEAHIISTGLADMKAHAESITTVRILTDRPTD